jgi:hypothetical protein
LWTIYGGYFILRANICAPPRRALIAASLSIIGVLDVPLVIMATRWYRGIHPVSPEMEPGMYFLLLGSAAAFLALFVVLVKIRRTQIGLSRQIDSIQRHGFAILSKETA